MKDTLGLTTLSRYQPTARLESASAHTFSLLQILLSAACDFQQNLVFDYITHFPRSYFMHTGDLRRIGLMLGLKTACNHHYLLQFTPNFNRPALFLNINIAQINRLKDVHFGLLFSCLCPTFTTNFSSVHATRQLQVTAQDLIFNCTNLFPNYTLCVQLHVKITPEFIIIFFNRVPQIRRCFINYHYRC